MTRPALPIRLVVAERRRWPIGTACSISEAVSGVAEGKASAMTNAGRNKHVRPATSFNWFRPASSTSPNPKQYTPTRIGALPNPTRRKSSLINRPNAPRLVGETALIVRRIPTAETRTLRTSAGPLPAAFLRPGPLFEVFSRRAMMNTLQKPKSDTCARAAVHKWRHPTAHRLACDLFRFVHHSTISQRWRVPAFAGTSHLTVYRCLTALTMWIRVHRCGTRTHWAHSRFVPFIVRFVANHQLLTQDELVQVRRTRETSTVLRLVPRQASDAGCPPRTTGAEGEAVAPRDQRCPSGGGRTMMETRPSLWKNGACIPELWARVLPPPKRWHVEEDSFGAESLSRNPVLFFEVLDRLRSCAASEAIWVSVMAARRNKTSAMLP